MIGNGETVGLVSQTGYDHERLGIARQQQTLPAIIKNNFFLAFGKTNCRNICDADAPECRARRAKLGYSAIADEKIGLRRIAEKCGLLSVATGDDFRH